MKYISHGIRFANNSNKPHESEVVSGLTYTPSEAARMISRGAQIDLDVMKGEAVYDTDKSMSLSVDKMRGVDMNDVFEAEAHSTEKLRAFRSAIDKHKISMS